VSAGETFYMTKNKATAVSAFQITNSMARRRERRFIPVKLLTSTIR
jgi:hypothetical protein